MSPAYSAAALDFDRFAMEVEGAKLARKRVLEQVAGGPVALADNKRPGELTPFVWQDPASIPKREYIHAGHYVRNFLTATVAPGGVGKTASAIVECLAMVTGFPLPLGGLRGRRFRVAFVCGEDPIEEVQRRFQAAMLYYRIDPSEVEGRLFINSGHDANFVFAGDSKDGVRIASPVVESVTASLKANKIDVLILDPWISFHEVPENENHKVQKVATQLALIAKDCGVSIELIAHAKKLAGREMTSDDVRGASSLHDKVRSLRVINRMTFDEGKADGLKPREHRNIFRLDMGKTNMKPGDGGSNWRRLVSQPLGNGDDVGVVTEYQRPDFEDSKLKPTPEQIEKIRAALAGHVGREDKQSADWAGFLIAEIVGADATCRLGKMQLRDLLQCLIEDGYLAVQGGHDKQRKPRKFISAT